MVLKKKRLDYVRKEFMHFIASTVDELKPIYEYKKTKKHPEYQLTNVDSWAFDLLYYCSYIEKSMRDNANKFLSHLQVNKKAGGGDRVISFNNPSKTEDYWLLHNDFNALPDHLQRDLALYAIMFNGARFGTSNFVLAIPPQHYRNFSKEYTAALEKAINGTEEYKSSLLIDLKFKC